MIHQAKFRNIAVRYSVRGKGRVVVLLHGFLESLEIFDELSAKLAKTFRVVSIDLPGHGKTTTLGYLHSMDLMADCVKAVMDSLQLRKYVLVGHSMGGYVALAFIQRYPNHVAGLCLLHSTAMPDGKERQQARERMVEVVKQDRKGFVSELIPNLFASENLPLLKEEVEHAKRIAWETSKEGVVAALRGMKVRPSYEQVLTQIKVPVLFIIGKKDSLLAWDNLMLLTSLPKKSFHVVLEHAGHMGFLEAPEKTFKAIRKFARLCYSSR